jgi:DNA-directed RNA polymerase subunit alpha
VLHEDAGRMDDAADCLRRVLSTNPGHERARLFLKDVLAANDMFIDDELGGFEKRNAVLDIPVTDFELSVRSRNCLKKMNIHTLGDLLRTTEAELLSYKNFGETSLKEIKAMLTQKGLVLGQLAHEKRHMQPQLSVTLSPSPLSSDVMSRPVSVLQLSVRARKCLQGLNISTIGELTMQTENELMSSRNFGQTSLQEIKSSLAELGLSLREV